jgi:hypothetical protein
MIPFHPSMSPSIGHHELVGLICGLDSHDQLVDKTLRTCGLDSIHNATRRVIAITISHIRNNRTIKEISVAEFPDDALVSSEHELTCHYERWA